MLATRKSWGRNFNRSAGRSKSVDEQLAKAETDDFLIKYLIWQNNDSVPFPETKSRKKSKFSNKKTVDMKNTVETPAAGTVKNLRKVNKGTSVRMATADAQMDGGMCKTQASQTVQATSQIQRRCCCF